MNTQRIVVGSLMVFGAVSAASLTGLAQAGSGKLSGGVQPAVAPVQTPATTRALLDQYCVTCHNQRSKVGGLTLDDVDVSKVGSSAEVWEKMIQKLRAGTMPPVGRPRPDPATYGSLTSWIEHEIDTAATAGPKPGRTEAFHRLNRAEYRNVIRDLLALDVDVTALLPADNTYEHGFDNNGDMLSVSPELMSRYMSAARKISRLAVGISPTRASTDTYRVHPNMWQDDRLSEDLPFGSRGGLAVRHVFPVDGEYAITIRLHRNFSDYIKGFSRFQTIDIRLDGAPLKQFSVGGGETKGTMAPLSFSGNIAGDPEWEYFMNTGDAGLEVRFTAKAGPATIGVSFLRQLAEQDGVLHPRQRGYGLFVDEHYERNAMVEQVVVGGPYRVDGPGDTPSRQQLFVCQPATVADEEPCARTILSTLGRRAYRRPVTDGEVAELLEFYKLGRVDGTFDMGVQFAVERLLVDPEFLYRIERDPSSAAPGSAYRLSDLELASRLSFFLWSSIPDDTLLDLATEGRLKEPAVLDREVRRMLVDAKSRALVENFGDQWLRLRNLDSQARESAAYPEFDENLRMAFRRETEMFFESIVREDRKVSDFLNADYTFVNERLARFYGIPGVYGERFRRVTLDPKSPRGGLLGQGSLLTVTSHPNRTSPVLRGKWLLETILGAPPPEPPANVPGLPDRGEGGRPASVRERLEAHRKNPVCAACHAPMDPLGFALENFSAIGEWRDVSEAGTPIDSTGTMPSGAKFEGPAGLREILVGRRAEFAGTIAEKLMAYALGRGVEFYDRPSLRVISKAAAGDDYRWSSIVLGIVRSTPFQMRTARSEAPALAQAAAR
jgi:mono/diheme cytochrome c family protein